MLHERLRGSLPWDPSLRTFPRGSLGNLDSSPDCQASIQVVFSIHEVMLISY
jgi:hypothetical protein